MKKSLLSLLTVLLYAVFPAIIVYFLLAFVSWDINPGQWESWERVSAAVLWVVIFFLIVLTEDERQR